MRFPTIVLLIILTIGCATVTETVTPTNANVVPTSTQMIAVPPTATVRSSPTAAVIPTLTAPPTLTVSAEQTVLNDVITGLNNRDHDRLNALIAEPFFYGIYGVEVMTTTGSVPYEVTSYYLADTYRERTLNVSADPFAFLPPRISFESLNPTDNPADFIFLSDGWGDDETGKAALYFTRVDGEIRWQGAIVSFDNFASVPSYPTGEISAELQTFLDAEQQRDQLWDQLAERFPTEPDTTDYTFFNPNPSGTFALVKHPQRLENGSNLSLYNIETDELLPVNLPPNELGETDYPVMQAVYIWFDWIDDEHALFGFHDHTEDQGPNRGHLALYDITEQQVEIIEPTDYLFTSPSIADDGTVLFVANGTAKIWRDGSVTTVGGYGPKMMGAISADGSQFAFAKQGQTDANGNGGVEWVSHNPQTASEMLLLSTDNTVAGGFGGVAISPVGSWIAIEVFSDLPSELGVWLFSADGSQRTHLGIGTRNPRWLDDNRLIFTATINGETQTHLLNAATNERFVIEN